MPSIELLASEIALLSNDNLQKLAQELVTQYTPRADMLEAKINAAFFYNAEGEIVNE